MGLFINNSQYPVFKNNRTLTENNQVEFRSNYMTELLKEQQSSNEVVYQAINALKNTHNQSNLQQSKQIMAINNKLHELQKMNIQQKQLEHQVIEWLEKLEDRNIKLQMIMTDEQLKKTDLMEQVKSIVQSQEKVEYKLQHFESAIDEMINQIDHYSIVNNGVADQLQQVGGTNEQILHRITNIDETQQEIINRVDTQEGLFEKISRQMDNIRSILYERTNFLDEKIKKVYEYFNRIYS